MLALDVYPAAFAGTASVTVQTNDGHSDTATAPVDVSDSAPNSPGPPVGFAGVPGSDGASANFSWAPPTDLGGGTLGGYALTVTQDGVVDPILTTAFDPSVTTQSIAGLAPGAYRAQLYAYNEVGPSSPVFAGPITLGGDTIAFNFTSGPNNPSWTASGTATSSTVTLSPHGTGPVSDLSGTATLPGTAAIAVSFHLHRSRLGVFGFVNITDGKRHIVAGPITSLTRTGAISASGKTLALALGLQRRPEAGVLQFSVIDSS